MAPLMSRETVQNWDSADMPEALREAVGALLPEADLYEKDVRKVNSLLNETVVATSIRSITVRHPPRMLSNLLSLLLYKVKNSLAEGGDRYLDTDEIDHLRIGLKAGETSCFQAKTLAARILKTIEGFPILESLDLDLTAMTASQVKNMKVELRAKRTEPFSCKLLRLRVPSEDLAATILSQKCLCLHGVDVNCCSMTESRLYSELASSGTRERMLMRLRLGIPASAAHQDGRGTLFSPLTAWALMSYFRRIEWLTLDLVPEVKADGSSPEKDKSGPDKISQDDFQAQLDGFIKNLRQAEFLQRLAIGFDSEHARRRGLIEPGSEEAFFDRTLTTLAAGLPRLLRIVIMQVGGSWHVAIRNEREGEVTLSKKEPNEWPAPWPAGIFGGSYGEEDEDQE